MEFQIDMLMWFQNIRSGLLTVLFTLFTICTEVPVITVLTGILYWCIDKKAGQRVLYALSTSLNINGAIKDIIKMPRPIGISGLKSLRIETATGYSFPSGHTQTSTTFWTSMMILFKNIWIYIIGILLIIGAGVSRLYLGVHWPMDVIAGWIFGITLSFVFIKLFDYIDDSKNYYILVGILILFGLITYFVGNEDLYKIFGLYTGFVLGYMVEDTYIDFSTDTKNNKKNIFSKKSAKHGTIRNKIVRFIIGIISLLLVYIVFKYLENTYMIDKAEEVVNIFKFIKYTIVVFWGMAGAPALFKLFKLD